MSQLVNAGVHARTRHQHCIYAMFETPSRRRLVWNEKKSSSNIRVLLFPRIVKMAADVQKRKSAPSKGVSISIINDYPRSPSQSSPRQRRDTGTDTRSTKQEITEQI